MKYILTLISLVCSLWAGAQIYNPTEWTTSIERVSDNEVRLITDVLIQPGWHMYSQARLRDALEGPLPTDISFFPGGYELVGINEETGSYKEFEPIFEMDVYHFSNAARFEQLVKLQDTSLDYILAEAYFMVCDDTQCLPPSPNSLLFALNDTVTINADDAVNALYEEGVVPVLAGTPNGDSLPTKEEFYNQDKDSQNESSKKETEAASEKSLWSTFIIAFLLGFGVLLTPCVFPMIPMTVSFFTKQSKDRATGIRNAFLYGVFIIVIYTGLGTLVSAAFGSNAMYEFSTGVVFNAIMFVVLVLFAFSFMGAFEIMLPNSFVNKVDSGASRGGIIGIFFMALALAVVSFSCTFPIAGTALLEAATKGGIAPIISMLGFSTAIAIPFVLFAIFPGWMNSLPKSGGWLNTVKVVLGFLELAFALKFLSMIDLVLDLRILDRELFLALWIAIFGCLGLYLLGKIKLPHDSPLTHISVGRLSMAIIVFAFTLYMIPGLWGAPLKLISGFPPPLATNAESPYGVGYTKQSSAAMGADAQGRKSLPAHAHYGPQDLITFHDYDLGVAFAKANNKPVMLDFTGKTCVNCRKMEEQVWVEPGIFELLDNEVVLISLYVDDRTELPKEEQYESAFSGNTIKTYGQKWLEYQQTRYNTNAQPLYVIQDLEGNDLNQAVGYTPDAAEYQEWLESGIDKFKK
jgi:thiol:disulfide interchange protein DsbD